MRAIFGLVGILITVGVIVWFLGSPGGGLDQTANTLKIGAKAREQVSQVAGQDTLSGGRSMDSADLEAMTTNSKLSGMLVTKVIDGGAYDRYFGIKRNDTIVAVEVQGMKQSMRDIGDEEMAKAQIDDAFRKQGAVFVLRDEREVRLPAANAAKPANSGSRDPLQQQLDVIQQIPGAR